MRLKAPARRALSILLMLSSMLALSCQTVPHGPNLVNLTGLSPKDLGVGDELEIQGNALPEGKAARIAFRGDLYRPASRVERDVEIVARTTTSSPRSISVAMTEALRAAFTGSGDSAKHTTFRGEIEVSFAPKKAGAPPVVGVLPDVVLDVEAPLISETLQRQRDTDAAAALQFLGITLRSSEFGECCVVGAVAGRAHATGLAPGDKIIDLDGVTVQREDDLIPSGRSRVARITVRRAGSGPLITRELDVQGYRSAAPSELAPAVGLVSFFAWWLLIFRTRLGRPLDWARRWLAVRLRETQTTNIQSIQRTLERAEWLSARTFGLPEEAGWGLLVVMSLIAMTALATLIGLRVDLVSRELDLALWVLAQSVSAAWAGLLTRIAPTTRSTWAALKAAGCALLHQAPLVVLTFTVILSTRSVRFAELVSAQGASALGMNFFKSPPLMLLTLVALLALTPELGAPTTVAKAGRFWELARGLSRFLSGTVHLWSAALLVSLIAFGGYRVPFVGAAVTGSYAWQLVGVLLWLIKAAGVVLFVAVVRRIAGTVTLQESTSVLLRQGSALVAVGGVAAPLWSSFMHRYALGWLEDVTGWMLLASTFAGAVWLAQSALHLARANRIELTPNPWI